MKNSQAKKKSLFLSWMTSYIIILALPIAMSIIVHFFAIENTKNKIISSNTILHQQLAAIVETKINEVDMLKRQIDNNVPLNNFLSSSQPYSNNQRYNIVLALADFEKMINQDHVVESFYVYVHDTNEILTNEVLYNKDLIYTKFHSDNNISKDEWFEYLKSFHQRSFYVMDKNDGKSIVMAIYSLPNLPIYSSKATLVMFLNPDKLLSSVKQMPFNEGTNIYLLSDSNDIIISGRDDDFIKNMNFAEYGDKDIFITKISGEKTLVIQHHIASLDFKYITTVSYSSITQDMRSMELIIIIYLIVAVTLGIAIALAFSKKRYKPINLIIKTLKGMDNTYEEEENQKEGSFIKRLFKGKALSSLEYENEYEYIQKNLNNILNDSQKLSRAFSLQKDFIQHEYLYSLLSGNINAAPVDNKEILDALGFKFTSKLFAVLIIVCDKTPQPNKEISDNVKSAFSGIAEVFTTSINDEMIYLLNAVDAEDAAEAHNGFLRAANIFSGYKKKDAADLMLFLSNVYNGFNMISYAYYEARMFINKDTNENLGKKVKIISVQRSNQNRNSIYNLTPLQQNSFITAIGAGNKEDADNIIKTVIADMNESNISYNFTKCVVLDMAYLSLQALKSKDISDEEILLRVDGYIAKMMSSGIINKMERVLHELVGYIVDQVSQSKAFNSANHHLEKIIKFVSINYSDCNLSVSTISEALDMNTSYISKFFKDNAGIGLHTYINQFRINKAKELIADTDKSMKTILHEVGFYNKNTFIRAFKRFVGTTPSLYKNTEL